MNSWIRVIGFYVLFSFAAHIANGQTIPSKIDSIRLARSVEPYSISGQNGQDTSAFAKELLSQVGKDAYDGHVLEAIRKMQYLLILESAIRPVRDINFAILIDAANFYSSFDKRYGLEYYKKATALVSKLPDVKATDVFSLYSTRAGAHATLMELDSALYYYYKAIDVSKQDSPDAESSAYNNLGVYYSKQARYDSAVVCFQKALQYHEGENKNIMLFCAIRDNIAQIKLLDHQYEEVYRTYIFNDSVYFKDQNYRKALPNLTRLLAVMQELKMPGIEVVVARGRSLIQDQLRSLKADDILRFYRSADVYFAKAGKHDESLIYRNAYLRTADSLERATSEQVHELTKSLLALQESSYTNEIRANALESEKTKLQLKWTERIFLLSILSAGTILILLILYFRKRRQEMMMLSRMTATELRNQQMESRMMEQELILKKRDLTNVVLHNTQVYDLNQKMIDRLHLVSTQKQDIHQQLHSLLTELQQQNQIGDRAISIQANIESVNEAFYAALRSKYPEITKAEAELCGYIRINLSTKDISILKNVEASSVKMGKNRLRKRLGITPEVDLYAFIQAI